MKLAEGMVVDVPQSTVNAMQEKVPDTLIVKKVDFVAFIAQVPNCTSQTNNKSKKLDIIVKAAINVWIPRTLETKCYREY